MKNLKLDKQSITMFRLAARAGWRRLPHVLLVERVRLMRSLLLVLWVGLAAWTAVALLYRLDVNQQEGGGRPVELRTHVLDDLGEWIQQRERERSRRIFESADNVFSGS